MSHESDAATDGWVRYAVHVGAGGTAEQIEQEFGSWVEEVRNWFASGAREYRDFWQGSETIVEELVLSRQASIRRTIDVFDELQRRRQLMEQFLNLLRIAAGKRCPPGRFI